MLLHVAAPATSSPRSEEQVRDLCKAKSGFVRPEIEYVSRSAKDATSWTCDECSRINEPIQKLFFKVPLLVCPCGMKKFLDHSDFSFSLSDIKVNDGFLVRRVYDQELEKMCMEYSICQVLDIMHVVECLLKEKERDPKMYFEPDRLATEYESYYPIKTPWTSTHKFIKMVLDFRAWGVPMDGPNAKVIGDVCTIKVDDYQGIFEALADGHPLLAVFHPGEKFWGLEYCRVYTPPPLDKVRSCNQSHLGKIHEAHMVVLLGPACKDGHVGFFFINSYGELWCPRYMVDAGAVTGGVGKLNSNGLLWNLVKFCYIGEDGGSRRLKDETGLYENLRDSIALLHANKQVQMMMPAGTD